MVSYGLGEFRLFNGICGSEAMPGCQVSGISASQGFIMRSVMPSVIILTALR